MPFSKPMLNYGLTLSLVTLVCIQLVVCKSTPKSRVISARSGQCSKNSYNEVDEIIARMTEMNGNNKFPETVEELAVRCENRTGLLTKIEDLKNRCMDGLIKRIVSVLIYSVKKQRKSLCRKNASKKMLEFVSAGKCINAGRPDAQKCITEAIDHIVGIKRVDNKMKIPFICCTFVKFKSCLISVGHKNKQCTEKHIEFLLRRSEQVSSGPMNMACGEYNEETDRCEKIKLPKRLKGEKLPKSFLMPLVELFESFDGKEIKEQ